ncbi:MAG: delta-60 repeat domain-containing protein [Deltaproteobacteria bacterium]|nr:delta-60 repeat domain-containing protein [Deltaproteobacteria bacterium]
MRLLSYLNEIYTRCFRLSEVLRTVLRVSLAIVAAITVTGCEGEEDEGDPPADGLAAPFRVSVLINNGAAKTASENVQIFYAGANITHFYVTANSGCTSGGVWRPILSMPSPVAYKLSALNATSNVYVKFRNGGSGGPESTCLTASITHDNLPPLVGFTAPAANSFVNGATASSFAFSGTCSESGRPVNLTVNSISETANCTGQVFSKVVNVAAFVDGPINVSASQTDSLGNSSSFVVRQFQKDTVVPSVAISAPASLSVIAQSGQSGFMVSGACSENGQAVVLSGAASGVAPCIGGLFSASLDFTLAPEGNQLVRVDHVDAAGNQASQGSRAFFREIKPALTFATPLAGSYVSLANVINYSFSGTCGSNGQQVELRTIPDTGFLRTAVCTLGTWNITADLSSLSDGPLTFEVRHQSSLGSSALPMARSIIKDTQRPVIGFITPVENAIITVVNHDAVVLSGTCTEDGRSVALSGAVTASAVCTAGTFSSTVDISMAAEGPLVIVANQSDLAGNSALPASRTLIHELKPGLTISTPLAGALVNLANRAAFTAAGTCGANGQNVLLSVPGFPAFTDQALCSAGIWSKAINLTAIPDGATSLQADLTSAGGVAADPVIVSLAKDTVPPVLTVVSPTNGFSTKAIDVVLNGTCTSGLSVQVGYTGEIQGPASLTCVGGLFRASLLLNDGPTVNSTTNSISVSSSDLAGNTVTIARSVEAVRKIEPMGIVNSVLPLADGRTVIGGAFTGFSRSPRGNVLVASRTDGSQATKKFGGGFNGVVNAAIRLSDGSFIFGGAFTSYRGQVANRIARVLPSGELDFSFTPPTGANGFNNTVLALATDGISIYAGGSFTTYRGALANRISKISIFGVLDLAFSPATGANGANNLVNSVVWNGSGLFIGGSFTTYRGAVANRVAKVSDLGLLDTVFSPATGGNGANNIVNVVNWLNGSLYIGGTFTTYRGAVANRIAKTDTAGMLDATFSPATGQNGFNNTVRAVSSLSNSDLIIGGDFTTYRGAAANRLARINTTGIMNTAFSPATGANGFSSGSVTAVSVDDVDQIFSGGSFVAYRNLEARGVVRISSAGVLGFESITSAQANVILIDGDELICGGAFSFGRPDWLAQNIALLDINGVPEVSFSTQTAANGFNNVVSALVTDGTSVFAGGSFTTYRGAPANRIAKLSISGVLDATFSPSTGANGANNVVSALFYSTGSVYLGGTFTQYRGTAANRVTKVDAVTGVKNTAFSPNTGVNGAGSTVSAIYVDSASVYIGGAFTAYRGAIANRFAKLSLSGVLDTTVSPATGANGANNTVSAITSDGVNIFLGGAFTNYRGTVANRIAKIDSIGVLDSTFSPATGVNGANNTVLALEFSGGSLYAGGSFTQYRSTAANRVVKIDAATGAKDSVFAPNTGSNGTETNVNSVKWNTLKSRLSTGGAYTTYRGLRLFYFGEIQPNGTAD